MNILIVDRQRSIRNVLTEQLQHEGHQIKVAESYEVAWERYSDIAAKTIDLVICDDHAFNEWIKHSATFKSIFYDVIVVAEERSIEAAVKFIRAGATDYLSKPIDMNQLFERLREVEERRRLENRLRSKGDVEIPETEGRVLEDCCVQECLDRIVGVSQPIQSVKSLISKVAPSEARVIILGENGTGKELVARALHNLSGRKDAPFIEVNCAAIPSELIESELFGHEKGAFTSAIKQRKGKFELASGGTLFLDEVGDMSLSAQAKVLRVLEEGKITRVGGNETIDVDVRVISATNKDIVKMMDDEDFREDLYHRLSVIVLKVPSLEDRRDDIPLLVDFFIRQISEEYNIDPKIIEYEAVQLLKNLPWRGNVRELRNVIERLIVLCDNKITSQDVQNYV